MQSTVNVHQSVPKGQQGILTKHGVGDSNIDENCASCIVEIETNMEDSLVYFGETGNICQHATACIRVGKKCNQF